MILCNTSIKFFNNTCYLQLEWQGNADNEIGIVKSINKDFPLFHHSNIPDPWNASSNISLDPAFQDSNIPFVSVDDTVITIDPNYYRPLVAA